LGFLFFGRLWGLKRPNIAVRTLMLQGFREACKKVLLNSRNWQQALKSS